MFEELKKIKLHFDFLNDQLAAVDVEKDFEKYKNLMKEMKNLTPIVEKISEYERQKKIYDESVEILNSDDSDSELKELATLESEESKLKMDCLIKELRVMLLPKDADDERNVIIEIRAGAGGEEAALFSSVLYRMYSMYAESKKWKIELLNCNETELGGFKEVSFMVIGSGAFSRFKFESGVHRVQRVPETESQGRIHTSTVTVAVLPEAEDVEVEINPVDLKIDTYRASGAGGQHVNKTESAIRIIHIPSGLVVECQDERSQYKNKDKAMKILKSKLLENERNKQTEATANVRRNQVGSGDRSERIRTYNYPQGRVSDHRIGLTLYKLESVLDGNLDEIIEALTVSDRAAKLSLEGDIAEK